MSIHQIRNRVLLLMLLPLILAGALLSGVVGGVTMSLCWFFAEGLPTWWLKYRDGEL